MPDFHTPKERMRLVLPECNIKSDVLQQKYCNLFLSTNRDGGKHSSEGTAFSDSLTENWPKPVYKYILFSSGVKSIDLLLVLMYLV